MLGAFRHAHVGAAAPAEDGTLYTFGLNEFGQLGHSATEKFVPVSEGHGGDSAVVVMAAGSSMGLDNGWLDGMRHMQCRIMPRTMHTRAHHRPAHSTWSRSPVRAHNAAPCTRTTGAHRGDAAGPGAARGCGRAPHAVPDTCVGLGAARGPSCFVSLLQTMLHAGDSISACGRPSPAPLLPLMHACAGANEVWAWGRHESGQLGLGEHDKFLYKEPRLVKALTGARVHVHALKCMCVVECGGSTCARACAPACADPLALRPPTARPCATCARLAHAARPQVPV